MHKKFQSIFTKDAGIVYESFRNKMNRVIWNFWSYKTNPRNESLENRPTIRIFWKKLYESNFRYKSLRFGFANPDLRVRQPLGKFRSQIESTIWIFKNRTRESGFANLWSRIRQSQNETNLFGVRICDYDTKRIHGFTKRITFLRISYTIPASLSFTLKHWKTKTVRAAKWDHW